MRHMLGISAPHFCEECQVELVADATRDCENFLGVLWKSLDGPGQQVNDGGWRWRRGYLSRLQAPCSHVGIEHQQSRCLKEQQKALDEKRIASGLLASHGRKELCALERPLQRISEHC